MRPSQTISPTFGGRSRRTAAVYRPRRRYVMSALRDQLIRELQLRRYSPSTQKHYVGAVRGLAAYYRVAPDRLSPQQVEDYLLYLMQERQLGWNTVNSVVSGLKFFYGQTIKR